jgi:hypothetical protein
MREKLKAVATWICDTEEEYEEYFTELENNPDFAYYGDYNMIQDIEDELLHQGISVDEFIQLTNNRYGGMIEIIEFKNMYSVFVGAR